MAMDSVDLSDDLEPETPYPGSDNDPADLLDGEETLFSGDPDGLLTDKETAVIKKLLAARNPSLGAPAQG